MGIITISRGSYSKGMEIANKLAEKLGYECVSREILLKASKDFNIPEVKLTQAIHNGPSILDHIKHGKKKYIAFIRESFFAYLQKDNIVYHGLAGQFFTTGLKNIFKVRITANVGYRVKEVMKRENIDETQARELILKLDEERKKWSMYLYGIDPKAPELYDVVLHIDCIQVDGAVEILSNIFDRSCFQTTPESRKKLKDMYISARAYSRLVGNFPDAKVVSKDGVLLISIESSLSAEKKLAKNFKNTLMDIEGVKDVKTFVIPFET